MREFGKISCSIWASKKFARISIDARLLYFYLHTNRHGNSCGGYLIPLGYMSLDIGWDKVGRVRDSMQELIDVGLAMYDFENNVVGVMGWLDHTPPSNPKHAQKIASDINLLPNGDIKDLITNDLQEILEAKGWDCDTLSIPYGYTKTNTKTKTNTDTNTSTSETVPKISGDLLPKPVFLHELFPRCSNAQEFAQNVNEAWRGVAIAASEGSDKPDALAGSLLACFWQDWVGDFVGAKNGAKYAKKRNWFMSFEKYADKAKLKGMRLPVYKTRTM